jgi:hypothetical protein
VGDGADGAGADRTYEYYAGTQRLRRVKDGAGTILGLRGLRGQG